ncbi:unnamed protein product [Polarella glacialis]|uniref:Secreted protein n=1 Tax=Polarella glacialis TaxID=89957 RepID=A0A813FYS2_POLGL|nr:unnamed protein product [Polarella glacialis]
MSGAARSREGGARPPSCFQRALWVVLLLALASVCNAKPSKGKYSPSTSKVHWKKEGECARNDCKGFHNDENEDCISQCVSQVCYDEVYASEPLELGEVDRAKGIRFNTCVRRQQEDEAKKVQEERKAAKAAR